MKEDERHPEEGRGRLPLHLAGAPHLGDAQFTANSTARPKPTSRNPHSHSLPSVAANPAQMRSTPTTIQTHATGLPGLALLPHARPRIAPNVVTSTLALPPSVASPPRLRRPISQGPDFSHLRGRSPLQAPPSSPPPPPPPPPTRVISPHC